jgi:spermidine synthase
MVQQSESPLIHRDLLRTMYSRMKTAGFAWSRTLFFPQPVYPSGWWTATMAAKEKRVDGFRESDARNRAFTTRYYNADIHRGALAIPEFFHSIMNDGG